MAIGGGSPVAWIANTAAASAYDTTTHGGGQWTPVADRLYLAWSVVTKGSSPAKPVPSGNGLTWTSLADSASFGTNSDRMSLYAAPGTNGVLGDTTITAASSTGCVMLIAEFTGADVSTVSTSPGAGKSIVQVVSANGADSTTGTETLAAAASGANRVAVGFMHEKNEAVTPRANWTEIDDRNYGTPSTSLETQWRSDAFETTATATWATSCPWWGMAVEIATLNASDSVGMIPIF